jgi:hypothetical protein
VPVLNGTALLSVARACGHESGSAPRRTLLGSRRPIPPTVPVPNHRPQCSIVSSLNPGDLQMIYIWARFDKPRAPRRRRDDVHWGGLAPVSATHRRTVPRLVTRLSRINLKMVDASKLWVPPGRLGCAASRRDPDNAVSMHSAGNGVERREPRCPAGARCVGIFGGVGVAQESSVRGDHRVQGRADFVPLIGRRTTRR